LNEQTVASAITEDPRNRWFG